MIVRILLVAIIVAGIDVAHRTMMKRRPVTDFFVHKGLTTLFIVAVIYDEMGDVISVAAAAAYWVIYYKHAEILQFWRTIMKPKVMAWVAAWTSPEKAAAPEHVRKPSIQTVPVQMAQVDEDDIAQGTGVVDVDDI